MVKGYLKVLVLRELQKGPATGYEMIRSIAEYLERQPSAGSVYPLLRELKDKGLIRMTEQGRRKVYHITAIGKKSISKLMREKNALMLKGMEIVKSFGEISGRSSIKGYLTDPEHLLRNIDVVIELRKAIIDVAMRSDFADKEAKLRFIIKETIKKIKALDR